MTARWPQQLDRDMKFASERLVKFGSLAETFTIYTNKGVQVFCPRIPRGSNELLGYFHCLCIEQNAVALGHMSQGWARRYDRFPNENDAEMLSRATAIPPRKFEDRLEILIVGLVYRDAGERHLLTRMGEVERDRTGAPMRVKTLEGPVGGDTSFIEALLPEHEPTPELQRAARRELAKMHRVELESGLIAAQSYMPN